MKRKQEKIVAARTRLRERFDARMRATPSLADTNALGSGQPNRHGMPKLPPGQTKTSKWPVLDLGIHPTTTMNDWQLELRGLCQHLTLNFEDFLGLQQVSECSDFHCVTTWSRMDIEFVGVRLLDIVALANVDDQATHIMCFGADEYCTNLSLAEAIKSDVLLVHRADNQPLSIEHGGPVRMITPQLYAWKGTKWISAIEFMNSDRPGFWEQNGYSMTGNPWREDRYS